MVKIPLLNNILKQHTHTHEDSINEGMYFKIILTDISSKLNFLILGRGDDKFFF